MRKVLVAGASGNLGREVVAEFERRGYWVRALVRDAARAGAISDLVDDLVIGDVLAPDTIAGACDGVEVVFSSIGASLALAPSRPVRTFQDIDFQGNLNLLNAAKQARVNHFIYVSVFGASRYPEFAYVQAHEDFVRELKQSGIRPTVVRPTGFFSVNAEILIMAKRGPVAVIGSGQARTNPIHEADLARACVDALEHGHSDLDVGGPEIHTRREIVEMAFSALGRKPKIMSLPPWMIGLMLPLAKPFDRRMHELFSFLAHVSTIDVIAPPAGVHRLDQYFRKLSAGDAEK
ncbi:MAG: SDR family oxidoreductase [Acidobacteria bacterium]|nr:SDR family oxidoreductase [Acidobacteriota bacterium]MCW5967348.1 SDR family oxidoreductase [Blastocatellales bacterium]